ncbi:MAG: Lrp/AsnC family transcriptional regulator [Pseudomonadota bacterium]|nr:Lrp/AsnC family transcriptional regulator [Pseudomonadota bacterium]
MNALEQRLLNDYQRDFPLSPEPFSDIAAQLGSDPRTVLSTLRALSEAGVLSRVGPVFRPNAIGVSTLAAMAVPAHDLQRVADIVSRCPEVNHNYEREHRFNLWFVATAEDREALARTLESIERETGYPLLSLPMLREYHIDLGFHLHRARGVRPHSTGSDEIRSGAQSGSASGSSDEKLIEAIQLGLPLVEHPYRAAGERVGISEQAVLKGIRSMQSSGAIKRFGVVVRHHELGYRANAMVVWDVAADRVDILGRELGGIECVTLCYQRPRQLPEWRYNLFTMIHGKDREEVLRCIGEIVTSLDLQETPHEVLFSKRQFKQRGARYRGNGGGSSPVH